jgi:tetratricopeptide (TPR) repeat protein
LELADRPAEAADCCSKALNSGHNLSPVDRALLLGCLGRALLDLGRYDESQQTLVHALSIGDPTGTCRASIAELFLRQGIEPEKVLHLTSQVISEKVREGAWLYRALTPWWREDRLAPNLALRSTLWAQRAWALAILAREQEAREAIAEALQLSIKPDGDLSASRWIFVSRLERQRVANTHWLAGMALLTLRDAGNAAGHFKQGDSVDPEGKYGALCRKQLALLGTLEVNH